MVACLRRNQAKYIFRRLSFYDILHMQPEVAKKQIQVGGKIRK